MIEKVPILDRHITIDFCMIYNKYFESFLRKLKREFQIEESTVLCYNC